jgi:hypothetical protein
MAFVWCFRVAAGRVLVAVLLTLALPVPWAAFCSGWDSPREAMACCHRASHHDGPSAASSCCAAQEQKRHAQSASRVVMSAPLVLSCLPIPVPTDRRFPLVPLRAARPADARLLSSVFLI